ncbi:MAG: low temperature requirement protein A [Novosphingobium sp.]
MASEAPTRPSIGAAIAKAEQTARRSLLRNHGGGHAPVSFLELFFDLVFVFAITQLSHFLKDNLTAAGFAQALVMFLAVWWAWMYTTWATNWADPQRFEVRVMLILVMLASLVMAVALPRAFEDHALIFVFAYIAIQLGRTLFMTAILWKPSHRNGRSMLRIAVWFAVSAVAWVGGALADPAGRLAFWALAIGIEYYGPLALFPVPFYGRSSASDWDISGSHMAERCGLFIIIALGEGIIITGASFAGGSMEQGRVLAFLITFLSSVLMWWLYFDMGAERGSTHISGHEQAGLVARNAYTYLHMPIVLGIVIFAVGDAKLVADWASPAGGKLLSVLCGGALLFLIGIGLFKRQHSARGNFPFSHSIGVLLLVLLTLWAWNMPLNALQLGGLGAAVFALVASWEWISFHGGWQERFNELSAWARLANRY